MNFRPGDVIFFNKNGQNIVVDFFINLVSQKTHVGMINIALLRLFVPAFSAV